MPTSRIEIIVDGKDNASGALRGVGAGMQALGSQAGGLGASLKDFGAAAAKSGAIMTAGVTAPLVLLGKQAIATAADFESQMNVLGLAAKGAGASMADLSRTALQVGADAKLVGISASEAADAMTAFYKSGLDTNQILGDMQGYLGGTAALGGALRSAIDLAAASELDLAQASDLVTVAMKTFGISAEDASSIADSFVRAADASTASVGDLGLALKNIGPTAAAMGIGLDDVNVALALLSERGITGSEAGTALKSMLVNIQRPTNDVQAALSDLGVSLFDTAGNMRSLPAILGDLGSALNGVATTTTIVGGRTEEQNAQLKAAEQAYTAATKAIYLHTTGIKELSEKELAKVTEKQAAANQEIQRLSAVTGEAVTSTHQLTQEQRLQYIQTLAGTYGMNAMNSLLAAGSEGWDAMAGAVAEATSAQETAGARTQGLQAAMEQLKGAVESLMITAMLPFIETVITPLVQKLGEFIGNLSQANPELLKWGVIIAAAAAAAGPLLLVIGGIATGLGVLLSPIGLVIAGVVLLAAAVATNFGGIRDALQPVLDGLLTFGQYILAVIQDGDVLNDWLTNLPAGFQLIAQVVGEVVAALMNLPQTIQTMVGEWSTQLTMLRLTVETAFNGISQIVQTVLGIVIGSVREHATQLQSQFNQAYDRVRTIVQQVLAAVMNIVTAVLGNIRTFLSTHGEDIKQTLGNAWVQIGRIVNLALELIQATVVPILQAVASFIRDHGDAIQTVLSGAWMVIKNLIEGVLTLIEGIIKTVLQIIKGDWEGAWETIKETVSKVWDKILGIVEGILTQLVGIYNLGIRELVEKVAKWMGDTLEKVKEGWENVKRRTGEKLQELRQKVQDKFNEILDWLRGLPGAMFDIGAALIQGMIDGVKSMVGALVEAAKGVVGDAIAAAKNLLGIHSPSTVFADIGADMLAGMAKGVAETAALVVAALKEVMGEITQTAIDGASDFVQAAETILSALASMVEAVTVLATATLPAGDIGGTVDALIAMMQLAIAKMQKAAALFRLEAVQAAADFAQAGEQIVAPLAGMAEGFAAVAGYVAQQVGPAIDALFGQLLGTVRKLLRLAPQFEAEGVAAAAVFAQAGGTITGQLKSMADGFTAVAAYVPGTIGPAIDVLFDQLFGTVRKLLRLAPQFEAEAVAAAAQFAQAGGTITGQLKSMVDGFTAVAAYTSPAIGPALTALVGDLRLLVLELQTLASSSELGDTEAVALLGQRIGQMVGFVQPAIAALVALAAYVRAKDMAGAVGAFVEDLLTMANALAAGLGSASRRMDFVSEEAVSLAQRIGQMVGVVQPGVAALAALAAYVQAKNMAGAVGAFVEDLLTMARALAEGLGSASRRMDFVSEEAVALAQRIGQLVGVVQPAVGAISALAGYVGARNIRARVRSLAADLVTMAEELVEALRASSLAAARGLPAAVELAQQIGQLVGLVQPAVGSVTALGTYVRVADVRARAEALAADLVTMAEELVEALRASSLAAARGLPAAVELAGHIQALVGLVQPALTAIEAVAKYTRTANLAAAVAALAADVLVMAEELRAALGAPSAELLAAYEQARIFAEKINGVLALVQPAMELLRELSNWGGPSNIHTGMQNFLRHVEAVMNILGTTFQSLSPQTVANAVAFSEAVAEMVANVRQAMEDSEALAGLENAYDGAFAVGQGWLDGLLDGLRSRLDDLTALMTYIRGLFPSSPAAYGPWRDLPAGMGVSAGWLAEMAAGLRQTTALEQSLGDVRGLFNLASGAGLAPAYAGGQARSETGLSGYGRGMVNLTLNMPGPYYIREEADIKRVAEQVGDELARQANVWTRMGA